MRGQIKSQAQPASHGYDPAGAEIHSRPQPSLAEAGTEVREESWQDLDGADLPDYLVRYYRWAYLWRAGVWLFDHQPIINAILFGRYRAVMDNTLRLLEPSSAGTTLQIAGVYGELTPTLAGRIDDLHMIDIAGIQLDLAQRKLAATGGHAVLGRMNAESLDYADDRFDSALMFLLLHEMPASARQRTLAEAVRVIRRGGRLVIAEYGELGTSHSLHRIAPLRWMITRAEPFLAGFWKDDLSARVSEAAAACGKQAFVEEQVAIFGGFYRIVRYRIG